MGKGIVEIRQWEKKDVEDLIILSKIMWEESMYKDISFSEDRLRIQYNYLLSKPFKGMGFVAIENNKMIGAIVVMLSKYFFSNEIFCFDLGLFINPKYRKSIKTPAKLIKVAGDWGKKKGAKEFRPASSVGVRIDKIEKFYNFLKFKTVGNVFSKRL
jgi:hypothetical protein|tara:strand:+ start:2193 stop:2663 length:471 start_codon:yes stop_codon:yes gene_type:complete